MKSVSVKDIARELNISLSTVHKALTGKPGVGEQRRKQVLETAQRLGYSVNAVAQSLSRKDITLGIFMPSNWQNYFESMQEGIQKEIDSLAKYKVRGLFYHISSDFSDSDTQSALLWLKENRIDALIYCPSMYNLNDTFVTALKKSSLPVFIAGGDVGEIESITAVVTHAVSAGKLAADFLHCVHGKKLNAVMFTGSLRVDSHREKTDAFRKRVEKFGGKVCDVYETEDNTQKAYECAKRMLVEHSDVNAVYVSTATSEPVCRYIEQMGYSGKITLVCTDIFDELRNYMKNNTVQATVYQNQKKVGSLCVRKAYEYLVEKNSYHTGEKSTVHTVYVRPALYLLTDVE